MRYIISFLLVLIINYCQGQYISSVTIPDTSSGFATNVDEDQIQFASSITPEEIEEHINILASDDFLGRETGTEGIIKAAKYISGFFDAIGLDPIGLENSHYQDVAFTWSKWVNGSLSFQVNGNDYKHLFDYVTFPNQNTSGSISSDEVVFLGYGIDDKKYSDYKKNDVNGKVILIYDGEPVNKDSISQITKSHEMSEWSSNVELKLRAAKKHGVKEVLIIPNDFKKFLSENRRRVLRFTMELGDKTLEKSELANATYISTNIAREIMGDKLKKVIKSRDRSKKRGKACDVPLETSVKIGKQRERRTLSGNNVMGFIEGSDKKDEVIVITAHYDHVGSRGDAIYNGANDNASGTATVMEVAEAFHLAKKEGKGPRRSILCLLVTAEEKGLLGSQYYSERPIFPIEKTVCNINIDMVGRSDKKYADNPNFSYVIGSDRLSTDLHKINEKANQNYTRIVLDYTYNAENDPNRYYYRSDHFNFARKGIPALFFFNGVHKDYHRVSDTIEKLNFDQITSVGRLIFHTAWEVANREDRIVVDGEVK